MRHRDRFSERFGLTEAEPSGAQMHAPPAVRLGILNVACEFGLQFGVLRAVLCREFRKDPQGGVSGADLWEDAKDLLQQADWPGVYDVAEALYELVARDDADRAHRFEIELNRVFRSERVGFEMCDGEVCPRLVRAESTPLSLPRSPPNVIPVANEGTPDVSNARSDSNSRGRAISRPRLLTRAGEIIRAVVTGLVGIAERPGFRMLMDWLARLFRFLFRDGIVR